MLNWHVFALEKMRIQLWFRSRICLLLLFFWCICFDLFICENLKELRRAPWMRRICVILSIGNLWNIFGLVACLSRYFEKLLRFSDIFGVFFCRSFSSSLYFASFFCEMCRYIVGSGGQVLFDFLRFAIYSQFILENFRLNFPRILPSFWIISSNWFPWSLPIISSWVFFFTFTRAQLLQSQYTEKIEWEMQFGLW